MVKLFSKRLVGAFGLVVVGAVAITQAQAATITVDTTDDGGTTTSCTLRDAINAANTDKAINGCAAGDSVNDTIIFGITGTIALSSTLPDISSTMSINGPGATDLIIQGTSATVLKVTATGVKLTGLTLTGGQSGGFGGGLWVVGGAEAGVTNVTITANTAQNGGGIANGGTLVLSDSVVSSNTASGGSYGGGGIYNSGTLTLNNTSVTGNNSAGSGGGLYNYPGGTLTSTGSTIDGNTAINGVGGGISNSGTSTLNNTSVSGNNSANPGGGLYNTSTGNLTITGSTINGNTAKQNGGGGISSEADVTLNSTTVNNNNADAYAGANGAGINAVGKVTLTDTTVSGNSLKNSSNSVGSGAGIYAGGSVTLTRSTVSNNKISPEVSQDMWGAGIFSSSSVVLVDSTVSGNSGVNVGGGISAQTSVSLENSTISGNSSANNSGGIFTFGTLTLTNSTISGNSSDFGGGILADSNITLTNSTIVGNSAQQAGGVVLGSNNAHARLINNIIFDNTGGDCYAASVGQIISSGHNIDGDGSCNLTAIGDMPKTDPLLGPLTNNGGSTQTHALLVGSPAIDTGDDNNCPSTDQRGIARPQDGNGDGAAICDIGAVERQPDDLMIEGISTDANPVTVGQQSKISITVNNAGPDAVNDVMLTVNLPVELTFVSAMNGCSEAGGAVSCALGTLAAAAKTTIDVTTNAEASGDATISANVTGTVVEANTNNNAAQTVLTINENNSSGAPATPSSPTSSTSTTGGSGGGSLSIETLLFLVAGLFATTRRRKCKL